MREEKKSQLTVSTPGEYVLGGQDVDLTGMVAWMKTPLSTIEQCLLKKMQNGKLAIATFQPRKKGTYSVDVTQDGMKFPGSPFQIQVGDSELSSSAKVKASGATKEGAAGKWNDIIIDISGAGYGTLGISMEGSHRPDLTCKQADILTRKNEYLLQYRPPEPGIYLLNIQFANDHITGSPFMVNVGGKPSGNVRETVTQEIRAPKVVQPGQKCQLILRIPGATALDMEATLSSPSGVADVCEIRDEPDNAYDIRFTPTEKGLNVVSVKQKGIHIAGSPLQYSIGVAPAGGSHKVEFGGSGAERGAVGVKNEFNIYIREAGSGTLSITIEGPSKADIQLTDTNTGFITVSYVVQRDGEYVIGVKFNDQHVPKSPCKVQVDPECEEAKKVSIHGLRDRGLDVEKPATFTVNFNGVQGVLKGHVTTPSGAVDSLFIQEIDNELNSCRFLPKENGVYYVHLRFNDAHIPGSPFPMLIGKLGADPAHVAAKGPGLEAGQVGAPSRFLVTTMNAGAGTLGVIVEGPSKVAVACTEADDGYEFTYTPSAPGEYFVNVKYCNVGVAGSPFKVIVTGSGRGSDIRESSGLYVETVEKKPGGSKSRVFHGDASKVHVQGTGLKKGHIGRPGTFNIDLKDAGQGLLAVAMISPNGLPVKDLTYKKQKGPAYVVSYLGEEKGDHYLHIRWGINDVPGSPFIVTVQ